MSPVHREHIRGCLSVPDVGHVSEAIAHELLAEVDRLHTWPGLMSLLAEHYPAAVFTGESGEPGPVIIAMTRAVDRLRARQSEITALADELDTATRADSQARAAFLQPDGSGWSVEVGRTQTRLLAAQEAWMQAADRNRTDDKEVG
jgi:hypothetical protein